MELWHDIHRLAGLLYGLGAPGLKLISWISVRNIIESGICWYRLLTL